MGLRIKDDKRYTYGDYLAWPEDVRYELIDGVAYLMAPPAPGLDHQEIVGEIYLQLRQALNDKPRRPFIAPVDVLLPKGDESDEATDTVVQPDVFVVCDESRLDRQRVRGAPDWIVEVLSPATASHDQVEKRRIYERAAVKEYWLVHPTDRVLTVYHLEDREYGKPDAQELVGETLVRVLPGIAIAWDALVERLSRPES